VVFLAGFHSNMTGTKALFLEDYCRRRGRSCVRFDYFGHGASSGDATDGTIGRWLADATAVLDALTRGPQILVGSSMGGWIMLLAALSRRERVQALVGIGAAPDFTEDLLWSHLDPAQCAALAAEGSTTLASAYDPAGYRVTRTFFEEARRHLLLRGSVAVDCPVRLLHGVRDDAVPWRTSLRLAECLESRDVVLTLVKGGDHRLSSARDLARLAAALDELFGG
jgi:pimeloyl-ACP methyl ester carboxylesterase